VATQARNARQRAAFRMLAEIGEDACSGNRLSVPKHVAYWLLLISFTKFRFFSVLGFLPGFYPGFYLVRTLYKAGE
jgi:hypothetical protein